MSRMFIAALPLLLLLGAAQPGVSQLLSVSVVGEAQVQYQNVSFTGQEIRLTYSNRTDHRVSRFLSIGYAQPPVDDLRFGPPEPLNYTSTELNINATQPPPACPLGEFNSSAEHSEDCLYLSIRSSDLGGSQPVLILLASQMVSVMDGDAFSAIHDVVLATIQSRQGVLGYLNFDGVAENLGLRDQQLAIRFLDEAIDSFGGDRTRVTLAGHGDAAAAAGLLAVADGSSGSQFQRVAMLGGSIASPLAWSDSPDEARKLSLELANKLACNLSSSEESLNCLRSVGAEQLLLAAASMSPNRFVPVGAGEMFPNGTSDHWRAFNGTVLSGVAANAGGPRVQAALRGREWTAVTRDVFDEIISQEFAFFPRIHTESSRCGRHFLSASLADWPDRRLGEAVRPLLTQAIGDFHYTCPVWEAAGDLLQASAQGAAYVYQLNVTDPTGADGDHAADARYFLGEPLVRVDYPAGHSSLASIMMNHLDRFVKLEDLDSTWPRTGLNGSEFMNYQATADSASAEWQSGGFGLVPGRCPMWKHEMPFHSELNRNCGPDSVSQKMQLAADEPDAEAVPVLDFSGVTSSKAEPASRTVDYVILRNFTLNVLSFGKLVGETIRTEAGTIMSQFLGVPYALAPVNDLRFANPKRFPPFGTKRMANEMPLPCMQRTEYASGTSEDCLYLNIWTAAHSDLDERDQPVIVFLHGGFFQFDAISSWQGHRLLDQSKMVLVTVAYRLGAFGFLSLDNDTVPGNFGLRDQEEALKWISRHIIRFGGSPTKITLMGAEAGAVSIGYHLARSPILFQRAIMLTGSPYMPYPVSNDTASVRLINRVFAQNVLNCNPTDTVACLDDLRALNASFINEKQRDFNRLYTGIEFPPVIDGDFIRSDPLAMSAAQFSSVPLLIGGVNGPGNNLVERMNIGENFTHDRFLEELLEIIAHFPRFPAEPSSEVKEALKLHFTDYFSRDNYSRDARTLAAAIGNHMFTCSNQLFLDAVSADKNRPVYRFRFEEPFGSAGSLPGAYLFDDAYYAFGFPTASSTPHSPERANLSRALMRSLVDFTNTGEPSWSTEWPRYDPDQRASLVMSAEKRELATDVFMDRECNFWLCVLRGDDCFPPTEPTTVAPETTTAEIETTIESTETDKATASTGTDTSIGRTETTIGWTDGETVPTGTTTETTTGTTVVTSTGPGPTETTTGSTGTSTGPMETPTATATRLTETSAGTATITTTAEATVTAGLSTTESTSEESSTATRTPIGPDPAFIAVAVVVPVVSVGILGSAVFVIVKLALASRAVSPV